MGRAAVSGKSGGGAEKEVGVITLTYGGKTSFAASEVSSGLQYHLSRGGDGYGGKDCYHDVYFRNSGGENIGLLRYGIDDSGNYTVRKCDFANVSKFTLDVSTGTMRGLCLHLWVEKASDGTLNVCDSTGTEVLLTGVSSIGYGINNWRADIQCVFIVFPKEA